MLRFIARIDLKIIEFILRHMKNKIADKFMVAMSSSGNAGIIWIVMAFSMMLYEEHRLTGLMVILSIIMSAIVVEVIIKPIFKRNRPFTKLTHIDVDIAKPSSYSFPSGHSSSSFAAAFTIAAMSDDVNLKIIAFSIAGIIAFSRSYLAVHYPSDVIIGSILGTLISKFICGIYLVVF